MFNKRVIKEGIERLAHEAFAQGVDNSSVDLLLSQVKNYADDSLEEAFFAHAEDEVVLTGVDREAFQNFSTGYVRQMRNWHRDNAAKLQPVNIDWERVVESTDMQDEERRLVKKYLVRTGVLTVGAIASTAVLSLALPVGSSMSAYLLPGLIAELLVLSYLYRSYKTENQELKAMQARRIEMEMQNRIQDLINSIVREISDWFDAAERASQEIEGRFRKP